MTPVKEIPLVLASAVITSLACYASRVNALPNAGFSFLAVLLVSLLAVPFSAVCSALLDTRGATLTASSAVGGLLGYIEAEDTFSISNNLNSWSGMLFGFGIAVLWLLANGKWKVEKP